MRCAIVVFLFPVLCCFSSARAQTYRDQGIGLGGLTGAVIGGVIGHQNDETAEGALIGGAVGAIAGGVMGKQRDIYQQQAWPQYRYQQPAQVVAPSVVTPNDVIMMSRSGLSDPVIINHIRTKGVSHSLAVHDVISLHQQGVSEAVISAMQTAPVGGYVARTQPVPTVIVQPQYRVGYPYGHAPRCYPHHRRCW